MVHGGPLLSPWMFYNSGDDANGKKITATVTFSGTILAGTNPSTWTNPLTGGTFHRDGGCLYNKVIVGPLNPDGSPSVSAKVIDVSTLSGDRVFTQAQMNSAGLNTVADIATTQVTASF